MLKISIITVTFNNVKTIEQTIKSVLDQNYSNLEYIVIDGGSKDGALEILNKYKNKFNYFKSSPDEGVFDAMNKGISEATGDLIGFVNGDDFLYENTLQEINNLFYQKEKNLFFSVADVDYIDDENNVIGSTRCRPTKQILSRKYLEMPGNHLGCFVPLKAFKEVGLFETKYPYRADWLFFLLLIKKGYRPLHLKKKIGGFRLGGQSGGYGTFLENFKIVMLTSGSFFISFYSTFLSLSKRFTRRNFPRFYNFVVKQYYRFNTDLMPKEIFLPKKINANQIIDADVGNRKIVKKIAVFMPENTRHNNAFGTGQYEIFKSINESKKYDVTFFLDNKDVYFSGVQNKYIKENKIISFIARIYRKLFGLSFLRFPYYGNLNFNNYDIVVTEGIHYAFLKYFDNFKGKLILNDSITSLQKIRKIDYKLVNKSFKNSLSVVVNEKIPILYKENNLLLKTRVIGHSLKLDKFNFIERASFKGKILSIGRLVEEKGYIYIFSAIKQIIVHYPDVTLDVYGEGPLEKDLSDYIKENNLHNNIFLRGFLEHKKLLNSFCDYDLFISHPIEMDHIAEAFHMGNMEAMASGLPVITTDCGGVPFVVKDNAIVCRQMSIEDIVKSIEKLLTDKILFNKMSVKSRKYIEDNFSHEIIVKKWREVFDEK